MPHLLSFEISNYKGISSLSIDISRRSVSPVTTLIGLNESGKTTILEAISEFVSNDRNLSDIFDVYAQAPEQLIPIDRKSAFTGAVKITAHFKYDDVDRAVIRNIISSKGLQVDLEKLGEEFSIESGYKFKDSKLVENISNWDIRLWTRKTNRSKFTKYQRPENKADDLWLQFADNIEERLPRIAYFPTFLVDLPN